MKVQKIFLPLILFLSLSSFSKAKFEYVDAGMTTELDFVLAESWGYLPVATGGINAGAFLTFDLGTAGGVEFIPTIRFWLRGGSSHNYDIYWDEYKQINGLITLNFFDVKYLPPVNKSIPIIPYVGLSVLPAVLIEFGKDKYIHHSTLPTEYVESKSSWSDVDPGFNLFAGIKFRTSGNVKPYVEFRLTASDITSFYTCGGLHISFK